MAAVTSAVVGAGTAIYGAKKSAKSAKDAAASTKPTPINVRGPYGSTTYSGGTLNVGQAPPNPFAQMFQVGGLMQGANAFSAPGAAYYGAPKEVVQAAQAAGNTDAEAAGRLELLRNMAAPESNRQALALRERLFGRGTLGSSGGAAEQRAFLEAENQADLGRQMTATDWANARAQQRFANALSATGFGVQTQNQQFNQFAASQAGANQPFANALEQARLAIAGGGGVAPAAAINAANASAVPGAMVGQAFQQILPMMTGGAGKMTPSSLPAGPPGANYGY